MSRKERSSAFAAFRSGRGALWRQAIGRGATTADNLIVHHEISSLKR
jgi:hypothetical protein